MSFILKRNGQIAIRTKESITTIFLIYWKTTCIAKKIPKQAQKEEELLTWHETKNSEKIDGTLRMHVI